MAIRNGWGVAGVGSKKSCNIKIEKVKNIQLIGELHHHLELVIFHIIIFVVVIVFAVPVCKILDFFFRIVKEEVVKLLGKAEQLGEKFKWWQSRIRRVGVQEGVVTLVGDVGEGRQVWGQCGSMDGAGEVELVQCSITGLSGGVLDAENSRAKYAM